MDVAFNAAASGIAAGLSMLDAAAGNIASAGSSGFVAGSASSGPGAGYGNATGDLSSALPDAFLAALMVKVNATSMSTAMAAYSSIGF